MEMNKMTEMIRNEITGCIKNLSERQLGQVLQYVRFISGRTHKTDIINVGHKRRFLQEYAGGVSHGSLASDIDEELYG